VLQNEIYQATDTRNLDGSLNTMNAGDNWDLQKKRRSRPSSSHNSTRIITVKFPFRPMNDLNEFCGASLGDKQEAGQASRRPHRLAKSTTRP